jgi:hypothetical protein
MLCLAVCLKNCRWQNLILAYSALFTSQVITGHNAAFTAVKCPKLINTGAVEELQLFLDALS